MSNHPHNAPLEPSQTARDALGHPGSKYRGGFWQGVSPATACARLVLLVACAVGMLISTPLWTNSRPFPLLPVGNWVPILPSPYDVVLFAATLLSLVLALRFYRLGVRLFLAGAILLVVQDQNRIQPWFYLYWVLLFLTLFREPVALAGCRFVVSALYLWSGIQKFNPVFFQFVAPWFVEPFANWAHGSLAPALRIAAAASPVAETGIGVLVWIPRCRRWAIGLAIAFHAAVLLCLGPLGHNYNVVVWPWNMAMVALVWALFSGANLLEAVAALRNSRLAVAAVALICLTPALSFAGWWDSYLSFAYYSGNGTIASIYVSQSFRDRLPPELQAFVKPNVEVHVAEAEGPYQLDHTAWGLAVLRTPPLPEPRSYKGLVRFLVRKFPGADDDVRMVLKPKAGDILCYRGEKLVGTIEPR